MTLKDAAQRVFDTPEWPSLSLVREYFELLDEQLIELGFTQAEFGRIPANCVTTQYKPTEMTLQIVGEGYLSITGSTIASLLTLKSGYTGESPKLTLTFHEGKITNRDHVASSASPTSYSFLYACEGNESPAGVYDWDKRDHANIRIAEWILNFASLQIAHNLKPQQAPQVNLSAPAAPQAS